MCAQQKVRETLLSSAARHAVTARRTLSARTRVLLLFSQPPAGAVYKGP